MPLPCASFFFFFFNDTATTEIYTLSLHDALPISGTTRPGVAARADQEDFSFSIIRCSSCERNCECTRNRHMRSEEHTSELQSQSNLVCRLLLEKKKKK